MDWGGPTFVILIIAVSTAGWLINNWIRAKHGYPLEDEWGGKSWLGDTSQNTPANSADPKLIEENRRLNDQVEKMQDRLVVLERIVTDKGYRLNEEIEALRNKERM